MLSCRFVKAHARTLTQCPACSRLWIRRAATVVIIIMSSLGPSDLLTFGPMFMMLVLSAVLRTSSRASQ